FFIQLRPELPRVRMKPIENFPGESMSKMIEVIIDSVRVSLTNQQRIVILKQVNQERYLPIWIGLYEAEAITIALQEIQVARPQTHDLLKTLILSLNAILTRVEVISLSEDVFYGNLIFNVSGQQRQIDCRPSDALALASRMDVPIMVSEDVLNRAGIVPEEDITEEESEEIDEALFADGEGNLDVFENFLQNFDIEDHNSNSDNDEQNEN
ncbi:MAG: bifunctional nuclease family protein, partial [Chloroflexota bacterium]|nr:bifunctional nuclease family protein [Chloroflexota bacterium]